MLDERLSTREAREQVTNYQNQGRGKRLNADSMAAAVLIENWYYDNTQGILP